MKTIERKSQIENRKAKTQKEFNQTLCEKEKQNLGNVFQLGELESDTKATEEDGDVRASITELTQTQLFLGTVNLTVFEELSKLLKSIGYAGQRRGRYVFEITLCHTVHGCLIFCA